jgi:hypothetical protein
MTNADRDLILVKILNEAFRDEDTLGRQVDALFSYHPREPKENGRTTLRGALNDEDQKVSESPDSFKFLKAVSDHSILEKALHYRFWLVGLLFSTVLAVLAITRVGREEAE